ncbi:MAG: hypothetical protein IT208_08210 [Chthonomonadales bacterium]|nr:hypothetical protein [Chthonomonadales bacterium]
MTRRELNLAIFEGTARSVLWQPRLETWIQHHREAGTLPERYRDLDYLGIYDSLGCSVRYAACAGIEYYREPDDVEYRAEQHGDRHVTTARTPSGEIRWVHHDIWVDGKLTNRRIEEYPVKTAADLRVATDLVERARYRADVAAHARAAEAVGHRGEPTVFLSSSGFTELIKEYCGLAGTYYLLQDRRAEVERHLEACDRRDDRIVDAAIDLPCRIFNLGDHANNEFTPPSILKRYLLPRWQRISARLHTAGRFVHTHWDGRSRHMLPYLCETGLDGVEALPPAPMGDMTLEEIKAAVGDRVICLDLLPAVHFLAHYSMRECLDFAERVIDMFAPRLILGVSDEISEVGEIEKIEAITRLVDRLCGLAD